MENCHTDSRQNSVPLCPLMDCPLPHLLEVMRCAPNLAYLLAEKTGNFFIF